ncbi:nuclear transport factor 2 family protein [Arthrobacter jiangjiafuii]|uniref:nuclear transport factor 2 family protein n=1 Tax=Arthrobacter jiangjiafuii TaxID=2817475 RepID=UPI00307FD7D9
MVYPGGHSEMRELMRRYVYHFVNGRDFNEPKRIMSKDYTLHMGSDILRGRDTAYLPAVQHQFSRFPHLEYSIHELIGNETMTAVRFSEHGRPLANPSVAASWMGVAIYRRGRKRLEECWVEQDHFGRRAQLASGEGDPIPPIAAAPWDAPTVGDSALAGQVFHRWAADLAQWPPTPSSLDPGQASCSQPLLTDSVITINAHVAQGSTVAANLTVTGTYAGGLPGLDHAHGEQVSTFAGVFATVIDGAVSDVRGVTNRVAVQRALRDGKQT